MFGSPGAGVGNSRSSLGAAIVVVLQKLLDMYPGAAAAYSTRLLSNAYAGPAIRVRRSDDNAESDIGFDASGNLNETELTTFVGAASGFVTTWYDQSGNARNATQATAANQPRIVNAGVVDKVNGRVSPRFTQTYLDTAAYPYAATAQNVESFETYTLNTAANFPTQVGSTQDNGFLTAHNATTRVPRLATVRTGATSALNAGMALTLGQLYQRTMYANRSILAIRVNGSDQGTAPDNNSDFVAAGTFRLGSSANPGVTQENQNISEIVLYTTDQSANRAAIEANTMNYFGITP